MAEMCKTHEDRKLTFFCRDCRLPLCAHCMMLTKHKGHNLDDLAETANNAKTIISKKKTDVEKTQRKVSCKLEEAKRNLDNYEMTAEHAKNKCTELFRKLSVTLTQLQHITIAKLDEVTAAERQRQQRHIQNLENCKKELLHQIHQAGAALTSTSDTDIVQVLKVLEEASYVEIDALIQTCPVHSTEVSFTDQFDRKQFERDVSTQFSGPALAQTGYGCPVSIVHAFRCSDGDDSTVNSLFAFDMNQICVLYNKADETTTKEGRTGKRRSAQFFAVFDLDSSEKISEKLVSLEKKAYKVFDVSPTKVQLLPSVSAGNIKPVSVTLDRPHVLRTSQAVRARGCYSLAKPLLGGKYSVHQGTTGGATDVFKINTEDPVDICVNMAEEYFAVIQTSPSSSFQSSSTGSSSTEKTSLKLPLCVAVFKKPEPIHTGLFQPSSPGFFPSAICFYTQDNRERLIVADKGENAIYSVDFRNVKNGLFWEYEKIASDCPWLVAPTAITIDERGSLWVACSGGHTSSCVPSATTTEYAVPADVLGGNSTVHEGNAAYATSRLLPAGNTHAFESAMLPSYLEIIPDDAAIRNNVRASTFKEEEDAEYESYSEHGSAGSWSNADSETLHSEEGDGVPSYTTKDGCTQINPSSTAPRTWEPRLDTSQQDQLVEQAPDLSENKDHSQRILDTLPPAPRPPKLRPSSVKLSPQGPLPEDPGTASPSARPCRPVSTPPVAPKPHDSPSDTSDTKLGGGRNGSKRVKPTLPPSPVAPAPQDHRPDVSNRTSFSTSLPKSTSLASLVAPRPRGPQPAPPDAVSPPPRPCRPAPTPPSVAKPPPPQPSVAPSSQDPSPDTSDMSSQPRLPSPKPPPLAPKPQSKANTPTTVEPKETTRELTTNSSDHMSELEKKIAKRRKQMGLSD